MHADTTAMQRLGNHPLMKSVVSTMSPSIVADPETVIPQFLRAQGIFKEQGEQVARTLSQLILARGIPSGCSSWAPTCSPPVLVR